MKHVPDNEVAIITNLVDSILAHEDLAICVREDGGVAVKTTRDRNNILENIGDTDFTILKIKKTIKSNEEEVRFDYLGQIVLIHGNGCDVISDHSDNLEGMFGL
ncbi:hypothetical protein [Proteus terrae]|uniref:hypothetical protein n=1 Tax=Proteus terrae TaxID=1574161 RepID=UPI0021A730E2|nr:hypothetical protein [Proteus terrae]